MPINEPWITATCDLCGDESEEMEMCALAGGGWDERYIPKKLERFGWRIDNEKTICETCTEGCKESDDDGE